MNPLILAKELLNFIKTIQIDQNLNDWICKGETDIAYSTPAGPRNDDGYLFEKTDKSFNYVIRSVPNENGSSYIVIESCNLKGQLYNMDLSNPKIFYEKEGNSYLLESYVMTAGMGRKKDIDVKKSFNDLGITTNEISVINDIKPDWSKTLTDILEWGILREKVKLDLKNNSKSIDNRFAQIIEEFKKYIIGEKTKIKGFSFQKTFPNYVWINDSEEKIGKKGFCHYELITREKYPNKIFVEIHFESKYKNYFKKLISPYINDKTFWNSDHKGGELSLAFHESYDFEDENLFSKLADALFYLESNFGELIRNEFKNIFKISHSSMQSMTKQHLNQILYGPPGTGKTYATIEKAIAIANPNFDFKQERKEIKAEYDRLIVEGQIVFTTFHQSMSYEDFIEGIKPETFENEVVYNIKNGIFKNICQASLTPNQLDFNTAYDHLKKELSEIDQITLKTPTGKEFSISLNSNDNLTLHTGVNKEKQGTLTKEKIQKQINGENQFVGWEGYFKGVVGYLAAKYNYTYQSIKNTQNFVIIIDEINRGNVSQIFGELITLIEEDKRLGEVEALEVTLPYSKDKFGVPANLYIIGTMNTADRSVEALDAALRRRFHFEEMKPKPHLIKTESKSGKVNGVVDGIDLESLLTTINTRIEKLIDKDHRIGHSYFLKVNDSVSLLHSFKNEIIPLLEEYFFGDFGKIGLVLGPSFVEKVNGNFSFAKFEEYDNDIQEDLKQRTVYKIKEESEWKFSEI